MACHGLDRQPRRRAVGDEPVERCSLGSAASGRRYAHVTVAPAIARALVIWVQIRDCGAGGTCGLRAACSARDGGGDGADRAAVEFPDALPRHHAAQQPCRVASTRPPQLDETKQATAEVAGATLKSKHVDDFVQAAGHVGAGARGPSGLQVARAAACEATGCTACY